MINQIPSLSKLQMYADKWLLDYRPCDIMSSSEKHSESKIMAVTHFETNKNQLPLKQRGVIFYCARWQLYNF